MILPDLGSLGALHRANKPTSYFRVYGEALADFRSQRGVSDVVRIVMVPGLVLVTKGPA